MYFGLLLSAKDVHSSRKDSLASSTGGVDAKTVRQKKPGTGRCT